MRISDWSSDVCSSDLVLASEVVDDERNVDTALPRVADGVPNAVADGVSCKDIIEEQEFASCPIDQPAQAIQRAWAGCCEAQPVPFDDEITALRCRFRHALITRWRCIPYSSVVETKQLIAQAHACASSFPVHIRGRQGLPARARQHRSEEHTSALH